MKKIDIIQSSKEPSPFNLWLNGDVLKKYTSKGWKSVSSQGKIDAYTKEEIDNKLLDYDTTELNNKVNSIETSLNTLVNGESVTEAIDTFNEIESFLQGVVNTDTLTGLLKDVSDSIKADVSNNYVKLTGNQNIDGNNTFRGNVVFNNNVQFNSNLYIPTGYINGELTSDFHSIKLGGKGRDELVFNEYGGVWKFKAISTLVAEITKNGVLANGYKIPDGTSSQFLKADGSIDESTYLKIDENGNVELPNNSITLGDNTSEIYFGPLSISPVYQNFIGMYFTKLYSRFSGKEILRIEDDYGDHQVLSVDVYTSFNDTVQTKTIKTQGIKISESGPYLDIAGSSTGVSLHLYKSNGASTPSNLVFTSDGVDCRGEFSAATFKKHSGTSTQFLKADGSVDETEYVDTDTDQTINGIKTFTNQIAVKNGSIADSLNLHFGVVENGANIVLHDQNDLAVISGLYFKNNLVESPFNFKAAKVIIKNGASSQFLKADGSLDSTSYAPQTIFTLNGYLNNGVRIAHANYVTTDFILINKKYPISYRSVYLSNATAGNSIAFYDKDKNFISGITGNTNSNIKTIEIEDIPATAEYIQISTITSAIKYFYNGPSSQANNVAVINAIEDSIKGIGGSDTEHEAITTDYINDYYDKLFGVLYHKRNMVIADGFSSSQEAQAYIDEHYDELLNYDWDKNPNKYDSSYDAVYIRTDNKLYYNYNIDSKDFYYTNILSESYPNTNTDSFIEHLNNSYPTTPFVNVISGNMYVDDTYGVEVDVIAFKKKVLLKNYNLIEEELA